MNPGRLADDAHGLAGRYFRGMQVIRRLAGSDPAAVADAGIAIAGAAVTAFLAWDPANLIGARSAGPPWLLVLVPLLMGAALALRRRAPLVMWAGVWAGVALQDLVTRHPPQGLEFLFVFLVGGYSLGAHASLLRSAVGLAVTAPVVALISRLGGVGMTPVLHPDPGLLAGRRARPRPPAGHRHWPGGTRRCSGRPSRPRPPSGRGSHGSCTTSSPITSA